MAETLIATITTKIDAVLQNALDLVNAQAAMSYESKQAFSNGTGANNVNNIFSDTRTLSASANEDLDLAGGLANALGTTLTFTKIKFLHIKAAAGNTNNVQITRKTDTGVPFLLADGDGFALTPGAEVTFVWPDANGIAVTGATDDIINVANSAGGTSVTYTIIVGGVV